MMCTFGDSIPHLDDYFSVSAKSALDMINFAKFSQNTSKQIF